MKYAVETGSDAMIHIPSFIKTGSIIRKLMGGGDTKTQRQHGDLISLLLFFQNKGIRLKIMQLRVCKAAEVISPLCICTCTYLYLGLTT
jgi:hypothetical protein